ncbi:MAG: bacteriohemerythrin [Rhodoferax sp.]
MLNDGISWLSEPPIQAMFMQFPLPLAVVAGDGSIQLLNQSFNETFDASCLKSQDVQKIFQLSPEHSPAPFWLACSDRSRSLPVYVRSVKMGEYTVLVFEQSLEAAHQSKLAELQLQIVALEKLSSTDRLTGAWNRAHFDKIIAIELSRSVRYRQPLALIFFDIDHFKLVNDRFGHASGDLVLCELVKVVCSSIRAGDLLFRWGGEEFVILAPGTSYRSAANLAESLRAKIEQHAIETVGHVSISLGVAEHLADEGAQTLLGRADAAMYAAKSGGRNRVVVDQHGSSDSWLADDDATILHLSWHESYACGEATVDQQHRQLFDLANQLIKAAFRREANPQAFDAALQRLIAHVAQHFKDEEAILAQRQYPGLALHAQAHKKLIEHALKLRDTAASGGVTVGELVEFLADEVVARHMLRTDREFYPLFKSEPPALAR